MSQSLLSSADTEALLLSLRLALLTSATLLVLCTPVALWLSLSRSRIVPVAHALFSMPLVLPPTVLGFYLLLWLGPHGMLGRAVSALGLPTPAFSFSGLWIASLVVSAPFVIQPLHTSFSSLGKRPWEAAATLRASPATAFFRVVLPMARRGYLAAFVLSFAHTLGEFGVVLMVGGNILGRTRTLSTAIFGHVEGLDYTAAHRLSAVLVCFGFAMVSVVQLTLRSSSIGDDCP